MNVKKVSTETERIVSVSFKFCFESRDYRTLSFCFQQNHRAGRTLPSAIATLPVTLCLISVTVRQDTLETESLVMISMSVMLRIHHVPMVEDA